MGQAMAVIIPLFEMDKLDDISQFDVNTVLACDDEFPAKRSVSFQGRDVCF
jgi:hypothetical protein